jgi:hypothetical protein
VVVVRRFGIRVGIKSCPHYLAVAAFIEIGDKIEIDIYTNEFMKRA